MFNNLLESSAKKTKRSGSSVVSFVLHGAIVVGMVVATANAGQQMMEEIQEKVDFVEVKPDEPPPEPEPEQAPPPEQVAAAPVAKGFQVLTPPDIIPLEIPEIDLSRKVTNESDFSGRGVAGGIAAGVEGAPPQVAQGDTPYFEFQVEKPAAMAPGTNNMAYPEMLRSAQVEGTVLASFVVDEEGRADMSTFKVLRSDHELFTNAVKNALPRIRYLPAEVGGKKVKQLVQQPFVFSLAR